MAKRKIRWMKPSDLDQVLLIEIDSYEQFWDAANFQHVLSNSKHYRGKVATIGKAIVGYCIYAVTSSEIQIHNITVDREFRRQGIATELMASICLERAEHHQLLSTLIRESNTVAQKFFSNCGLKAVGVVSELYDGSDEDAYMFQYEFTKQQEPVDID